MIHSLLQRWRLFVKRLTGDGLLWRLERKRVAQGSQFRVPASRFTSEQRRGLHLLRANQALPDRTAWLSETNGYLAALGLDPVALAPGDGPLYFSLQSTSKASSVEGDSVSILMSAYNAEWSIDLAISSIVAQTWRNWELWVCDDRSTDKTLEKLRAWAQRDDRIHVLEAPVNVGPYVLRNWSLRHAKGRWVTVHDSDDWNHPQRLEKQVKYQQEHPETFGHRGHWVRISSDGTFRADLSPDGFLRHSSVTAFFDRQTLLNRLGGWDPVRYAGDVELLSRADSVPDLSMGALKTLLVLGLDHPRSLSADVRWGSQASRKTKRNRVLYREAFATWHASKDFHPYWNCFEEGSRPFPAPEDMQVPLTTVSRFL